MLLLSLPLSLSLSLCAGACDCCGTKARLAPLGLALAAAKGETELVRHNKRSSRRTSLLWSATCGCFLRRTEVWPAARLRAACKPLLSNGPAGATVSGFRSRRARERSAAHGSRNGASSGLQIAGPGVPYSKQMAPRTTTVGV